MPRLAYCAMTAALTVMACGSDETSGTESVGGMGGAIASDASVAGGGDTSPSGGGISGNAASGARPSGDGGRPSPDAATFPDSGGGGTAGATGGTAGGQRDGGPVDGRCSNTLDCEEGTVCDPLDGACVECVNSPDCTDDALCVGRRCRAPCDSDNDCRAAGLLCNLDAGACVECNQDSDCADAEFCASGACSPTRCTPGTSRCKAGSVLSCAANGAWETATPCHARQSCVEEGTGAACQDWLCTPNMAECSGNRDVIQCSDDGLTVVSTTRCEEPNRYCNGGVCSAELCEPNELFCQQGNVRQCDPTGGGSRHRQECGDNDPCDPASPACRPTECHANQPACHGNRATTCNGFGTGFLQEGMDCSATNKMCAYGECTDCPRTGTVNAVRLSEVHLGERDYFMVVNRDAACPAELSELTLQLADDAGTIELGIEPFLLAPGHTAHIAKDDSAAHSDTVTSEPFDIWATSYVLLCRGPCSAEGAGTILDAMAFGAPSDPPPLPAPVQFDPLDRLDGRRNWAYVRVAYEGAYPEFAALDWTQRSATYPSSEDGCPEVQPTGGCPEFGLNPPECFYGTRLCGCGPPTYVWICGG